VDVGIENLGLWESLFVRKLKHSGIICTHSSWLLHDTAEGQPPCPPASMQTLGEGWKEGRKFACQEEKQKFKQKARQLAS